MIIQFPLGRYSKRVPRGKIAITGARSKVYHTFLDCSKLVDGGFLVIDEQEARDLGYSLTKCKECEKHE